MKNPERPDPDLTTPVHDEIMLWLDGIYRNGPAAIVGYGVSYEVGRNTDSRFRLLDGRDALCSELQKKGVVADLDRFEKDQSASLTNAVTWELPVPGKQGTLGFVDLYVQLHRLQITMQQDWERYCGTPDCCHPECWSLGTRRADAVHLALEVKSTIPSLGELIRQIHRYDAALPWCSCPYRYGQQVHGVYDNGRDLHFRPEYVVVSPDTRWVEPITSQGITFIEYPSGTRTSGARR